MIQIASRIIKQTVIKTYLLFEFVFIDFYHLSDLRFMINCNVDNSMINSPIRIAFAVDITALDIRLTKAFS